MSINFKEIQSSLEESDSKMGRLQELLDGETVMIKDLCAG